MLTLGMDKGMRKFLVYPWFLATLALPATARAQVGVGSCVTGDSLSARNNADLKPDVLFRATVRAATLRFESAPAQELKLLGCPARDAFVVTTRTNLPTPVQPGVTYHNAVISIEIRSYVRCLAAAVVKGLCAGADSLEQKRRGQ